MGCNTNKKNNSVTYTVYYEFMASHPDTINNPNEKINYINRILYADSTFGILKSFPGDEGSPFNNGFKNFEEVMYFDMQTKKETSTHLFNDGELLTVRGDISSNNTELKSETKEILGYLCKKAVYTMPDGYALEYWYTTELPIHGSPSFNSASLGLVLEIGMFKAVKIEKGIPKNMELKLPQNIGKIVSDEELMKKMDSYY